jgi:hypothetical protein
MNRPSSLGVDNIPPEAHKLDTEIASLTSSGGCGGSKT